MMPEIMMLRGLPGSGKTTWAKAWVTAHTTFVRVNRDELRLMGNFGIYNASMEAVVLRWRDALIMQTLAINYSVVLDDTNLTAWHAQALRNLVAPFNWGLRIVNFRLPLEVCINRDADRPAHQRVGQDQIAKLYVDYLAGDAQAGDLIGSYTPNGEPLITRETTS